MSAQLQITFLRRRDVLKRTAFGKTLMYERIQAGLFPPAISISVGRSAWREDAIDGYNRLIASGASNEAIRAYCASFAPSPTKTPLKRIRATD